MAELILERITCAFNENTELYVFKFIVNDVVQRLQIPTRMKSW
jgi:hypothetical protein